MSATLPVPEAPIAEPRTPPTVNAARPRRLLIVSPNFPPSSAADMQRVRMSLPYFREFQWEATVLAVQPDAGGSNDPLLQLTVPADAEVKRVDPVSESLARRFGIGNIAIRAISQLYREGLALIASRQIDLVYFSTTMFFAMPLGRLWQQQTGVPFVLDIQDPWLSDYYETHPEVTPPRKHALSRRAHAVLERWTMQAASGLVAVSEPYIATLRRRYPHLIDVPAVTLPFAASSVDFEILTQHRQPNPFFDPTDTQVHAAYVGRAGDDMRPALEILFGALEEGRRTAPLEFGPVRLHFVGTNYSTEANARRTVAPVADQEGCGDVVTETPARAPYFSALQLLKDAAFLVLIGSDDPTYTASKVYPYLFAGKPIVAVVHERSSLVPVLRSAPHCVLVTFGSNDARQARASLLRQWRELLQQLPVDCPPSEAIVARYGAREMTRRQCELFDAVLARRKATVA